MIIPELKNSLLKSGLKKGDVVCISSDIANIGIPQIMKNAISRKGIEILLSSYIETFKDIVKQEGTILMPTFTYSACNGEAYDVERTKSKVGALTEYFRSQHGIERSSHPIFSFAAWGKRAAEFTRLNDYDCFGENSIFGRLYKADAKYVLFGIDMQHGASFVYYSEQRIGVDYRYFKEFTGKIKNKDVSLKKKIRYYVRKEDINYEDNWCTLEKKAKKKGIIRIGSFNGANILIIGSKPIHAFIREQIINNKFALIIKHEKNN